MYAYIFRRIVETVPVMLVVTIASFSLILLIPGDPALMMLGEEANPEALEAMRDELGLNDSIPVQYGKWLGKVLSGDLGRSLKTHERVSTMIGERIPVTAELGLLAMCLAVLVGVPSGIIAAVRRDSILDTSSTFLAILGVAVPNFLLGILLIFLFTLQLRWLPSSGYLPLHKDFTQNLTLMIMPVLTLGAAMAATQARQTRSSMLEVLSQDYIRTAWSKGLRERIVVFRHALKNALIPVITIMGLQVGHILGGSVIVESIFAIPGIGRLLVDAIFQRDFPIVQGILLVMSISVVSANLIVDIVYGWLDPRIRYN